VKLQLEKIEFRNLFSYGNKWQEFCPNGISFITGHNKNNDRRNFTGKSNLLKIFPYGLFGKVEGLNKTRIVNWRNRKNAECLVHFTKNNTSFCIHRGIKPDVLKIYENGNEMPIPASKKDFQKYIENEILEMDYGSFMNIVYADTNNSSSILKMTKPMKRNFLEQVFNLEYYTKLKDNANKKINSIDKKISGIENTIVQKEERIKELNSELSKYKNTLNELSDSSTELNEKEEKLKKNKEKYDNTLKDLDKHRQHYNDLKDAKNDISNTIMKIEYKIKELKKIIIQNDDEIDSVDQIRKEINSKNNDIKDCDQSIKDCEEQLQKFEDGLYDKKDSLIETVTAAKTEYSHKKKEVEKAEKDVNNRTTESVCPTCKQTVDHDLLYNHLTEIVDSLIIEREKSHAEYVEKDKELQEIKTKINEYEEIQNNLDHYKQQKQRLQNNVEQIEKQIVEIEKSNKEKLKSQKYRRIVEKLMGCMNRHKNTQKQFDVKIDEVEESIDISERYTKNYELLQDKVQQLKKDIEKEKEQRQRIEGWITDNRKKQKELTTSIESDKVSIDKMKNMKDYVKVVKDLCADEKVKQYTISNKVPLLNQRVNYYLSKAGVNYYVKLDNWLETEIKGPGIKDCVYENLSGAEKISLDRSLQFAFNDINKLQSPTFMDLLILDEILDSSVDTIGMKNIVNIVKTKQQEDDSNVLIVSHRESFEEMEHLVDNFYCVEFDGSYSQIRRI
jgi:DNA repair exonuclease SbcCD ATPase subunit